MSNGKNITYKCSEYPYDDGDTLIVGVGSNMTLTFKQMGIRFSFVADPSYNIGEVSEDNSLYLELSGIGNLPMKQLYNNQIPSLITGSVIG